MGNELLTAYVRLVPTIQGIQGEAAKAFAPAEREADRAAGRIGDQFSSGLGKTLKRGLAATFAGGALFAGLTGKAGLDRLMGIEDARASLKGLGHDGRTIDKIMTNALASVKGTAFGMADAGTLAATAVAAGIKPGKELTKYLKLTADTAAITKSSLADVGNVMNNVQTVGAAYNDSLQVLAQKGLPIYTWLSEELGISTDAVKTLASEGKISSEEFRSAIETNIGGAALASGDTTRGAFANMQASLGRIGANLLEGLFPRLKGGFQGITDFLAPLEAKASTFGAALSDGFGSVADTVQRVKDVVGGLDFGNIDGKQLGTSLSTALATVANRAGGYVRPIVEKISAALEGVDWVGLGVELGRQAPALLLGLAAGFITFDFGGLMAGIADNWAAILGAVLFIAFAPAKLIGALGKVLARIPLVGRLLAWFLNVTRTVTRGFLGFAGGLLKGFMQGLLGGPLPLTGLVVRIIRGLAGLLPAARTFFATLGTRLGVYAIQAGEWIRRGFARALPGVLKFVGSIPGRILSGVRRLSSILAPVGRDAIAGLGRGLRGAAGLAVSAAKAIPGKVKGAFSGAGSLLRGIGGNIIDGLISGISRSTEAVRRAIGNVGNAIKNKIKGMFGISSPSRWMRDQIGVQLAAGMAIGVLAGAPLLDDALSTLRPDPASFGSGAASSAGRPSVAAAARRPDLDAANASSGRRSRIVSGTLSIDESGRAYIEGIAEDVLNDQAAYDDQVGPLYDD